MNCDGIGLDKNSYERKYERISINKEKLKTMYQEYIKKMYIVKNVQKIYFLSSIKFTIS